MSVVLSQISVQEAKAHSIQALDSVHRILLE